MNADIEENAADVKTDPLLEVALRVSQASLNEGFISFNAYPEYREALAITCTPRGMI